MIHAIRKGEGAVIAAIRVVIDQLLNPGERGLAWACAQWVVNHIGHIAAPLGIPRHFHGIPHQGLRSHELHFIGPIELDRSAGFLCTPRGFPTGLHRDLGTATRGDRVPFLLKRAERIELEPSHQHLCALRLEANLARGGLAIERLVHEHAVDEVLQGIALGDDLHPGPLIEAGFDIVAPAKTGLVFPIDIAFLPVDPSSREGLARGTWGPDLLLIAIGRKGAGDAGEEAGAVGQFRGKDEEISGAAFDDLGLDAGHPSLGVSAVRPVTVDEDAVVARLAFAGSEGRAGELVFDHEVIVAVVLVGSDITESLAADLEMAFRGKGPNLIRRVVEGHRRIEMVAHLDFSGLGGVEEIDFRLGGFRFGGAEDGGEPRDGDEEDQGFCGCGHGWTED